MKDGIIKGNGTSRKVFANFPATYEEFRTQAAEGTLPLDLIFNPDGWQQQPDFLNQENLYQRSTAAVYGLNPEFSTPNDALYLIGRLNSGLGNDYLWSKNGTEYVPILGDNFFTGSLTSGVQIQYSFAVTYDYATKKLVLAYPQVMKLSSDSNYESLIGMYVILPGYGDDVYELLSIAYSGMALYNVNAIQVIAQEKTGMLGYVNSPNPDAYPSDEVNGITYTPLGKIGDLARVESGSYTGDGTASKTLEFKVLPKFLFIYKSATTEGAGTTRALWAPGITQQRPNADSFAYTGFSANENRLTLSGNGSGLTDTDKAMLAFNQNGMSYNYVALLGVSE